MIVSANMLKSRIAEVTKIYLKNCDKKGLPLSKNISEVEEKGIKEMKEDKENVTRVEGWQLRSENFMLKQCSRI